MPGYDIIGDVHGCATKLEALLSDLGYRRDGAAGAHRHPRRQAIFVGDLIDRGDEQLRSLEIAKDMVDAGSAQVVMGNHEFNAIGYATEYPTGSGHFLREHSAKNTGQHRAFLEQLTDAQRAHYVRWFRTLPLWLDLGGLRVVHACWHEESINVVARELGSNRFGDLDQIARASTKGNSLHDAVEVLLKGPETSLVEHGLPTYRDADGYPRRRARIRWWNPGAVTLREIAEIDRGSTTEDGADYPELPDIEVDGRARSYAYTGDVPVFYGHYWRPGSPTRLRDWTERSACVDFSAVNGGTLMAYRWSGEDTIRAEHYVAAATARSSGPTR